MPANVKFKCCNNIEASFKKDNGEEPTMFQEEMTCFEDAASPLTKLNAGGGLCEENGDGPNSQASVATCSGNGKCMKNQDSSNPGNFCQCYGSSFLGYVPPEQPSGWLCGTDVNGEKLVMDCNCECVPESMPTNMGNFRRQQW